jgi:hypothetical protein
MNYESITRHKEDPRKNDIVYIRGGKSIETESRGVEFFASFFLVGQRFEIRTFSFAKRALYRWRHTSTPFYSGYSGMGS